MPFNTFIGVVTKKAKSIKIIYCHLAPLFATQIGRHACEEKLQREDKAACVGPMQRLSLHRPKIYIYIKKYILMVLSLIVVKIIGMNHFFFFFKSSGLIRFGKECG